MNCKRHVSAFCVMLLACSAGAAEPSISNIEISQPNGSTSVVITYDLDNAPAVVTVELLTNGTPISAELLMGLTGDGNCKIAQGAGRRIRWRPPRSLRGGALPDVTARLTAWPLAAPPDYAVWDLSASDGPASLRFYPNEASIPGGIHDAKYATTHLVMRKIPAGGTTRRLGTNANLTNTGLYPRCIPRLVTFTRDYYMSVFELTQGQCGQVWSWSFSPNGSGRAEAALLPMNSVMFDEIRGATLGRLWPAAGESEAVAHQVDDGSIVAAFRAKTGVASLDLPTAAQWEFAYRAGTWQNYYWGMDRARASVAAEIEASTNNAWTSENSTQIQPVGKLLANAFGLYDMGGNATEFCLDWFTLGATFSDGSDETDPRGPTEAAVRGNPYANGTRVLIGGSRASAADDNVSASVRSSQYSNASDAGQNVNNFRAGSAHIGFRFVCDAAFLAGN